MENIQLIRKWSELHGIAVMALTDGKKLGTCDDFYFEPGTQRVYALRVKTGMFGRKLLLVAQINSIGNDAITVPAEEVLQKESDDKQLATFIAGESLSSYRIMSAGGTLVGSIGNILLDITIPTQVLLNAIELAGGLREHLGGHYQNFAANQVVSYGQDVLIIPDAVAFALSNK